MNEKYLLIFLNETSSVWSGSGWKVSTIFDEFPTVDQILDHSCLKSNDPNDVVMANKLVESKGAPHRFIYEGKKPSLFFECMIVKRCIGEDLQLWDLPLTGYADASSKRQILYK